MPDSANEQSSTEGFQVAESFGCAQPWGRSAGLTERSVALMPMPVVLQSFATGEFFPGAAAALISPCRIRKRPDVGRFYGSVGLRRRP
jgi:hypothetical protein